MCGSRDLAEELVQETYVKVLARPRFLRRDDDLGYLIKALRNTWYSHLRNERTRRATTDPREQVPDELAARSAEGDPESSLEATEVLRPLRSFRRPTERQSRRSTLPASATQTQRGRWECSRERS